MASKIPAQRCFGHSIGRLAVALALLGTAFTLLPAGVEAFARFVRSTPISEAVVATSPPAVEIYTAQAMRRSSGANEITVVGPDGNRVDTGNTVVDAANHRHFSVGLQPNVPPGRYLVSFQTLSDEDGRTDHGQFAFYVETPPAASDRAADTTLQLTTDPGNADQSAPSHTGLFIAIAVVVAVAIALVAAALARTRRGRPET